MDKVRTVRLYGPLGTKFGRKFRLAVASPAEAVQALCAQLPGFERYLLEAKDKGFGFAVFNGKKNIREEELTFDAGEDDIRIAPMTFGAKKGGVFQIIVGVIMVVVGAVLTYFGFGAIGVPLMKMGVAMIIGGIVQLLMPAPKGGTGEHVEDNPSYLFNGPINTTAQGHPVPLLYGRLLVGSAVISAGISVDDGSVAPVEDEDNPKIGGGGSGGGNTGGGGGSGGGGSWWTDRDNWNFDDV